jgi:peptidoglycan/LPS O-acetylase OafA/YrhL
MQFQINDAPLQNLIFAAIYIAALFFTLRKTEYKGFDHSLTTQLKGYAILAVIFSHIGYFLSKDDRFLWPFSISAGVGVNMFLFLSGFGLTLSQAKNPLTIVQFYRKRLLRLFIPMWIVLILLLSLDFFWLHHTYPLLTVIQSFFGFFPKADLYSSLNAPLWYLTPIIFYYLLFPLVSKRLSYLSPIILFFLGYCVVHFLAKDYIDPDVIKLYKVHFLAFPMGMSMALTLHHGLLRVMKSHLNRFLGNRYLVITLRTLAIGIISTSFAYYSIHSGVGEDKALEHSMSLILLILFIALVWLLPFKFGLIKLFGDLSYEVYLFHWPLLYRYDLFYRNLPASIATVVYLGIFLVLGFGLQRIVSKIDPQKRVVKVSSA